MLDIILFRFFIYQLDCKHSMESHILYYLYICSLNVVFCAPRHLLCAEQKSPSFLVRLF